MCIFHKTSTVLLRTLDVIAVSFRCRPPATAAGKVNPDINPNLFLNPNQPLVCNWRWHLFKAIQLRFSPRKKSGGYL